MTTNYKLNVTKIEDNLWSWVYQGQTGKVYQCGEDWVADCPTHRIFAVGTSKRQALVNMYADIDKTCLTHSSALNGYDLRISKDGL